MKLKHSKWMTYGTIAVCLAAIILTVFSIASMDKLTEQSKLMYEHPYQVKGQAQVLRTSLSEMKLYLPVLLKVDWTDTESTRKLLFERDKEKDVSIKIIRERYLGAPSDVDELDRALFELRDARLKAVDHFNDVTDLDVIIAYTEAEVDPYSDAADVILERISNYADYRVNYIVKIAEDTQRLATIGSVFLCIFIVVMAVLTNRNERLRSRETLYRNQLFDMISSSIGEVFYIYDCVENRMEYVSENSSKIIGISKDDFFADPKVLRNYITPASIAEFDGLYNNGDILEATECEIQFANEHRLMEIKLCVYPIYMKRKLRRHITVLYDQTKVIEQQNAMRDALLSAQSSNNAKREFLSRMSHEIRTPMNTIIGMSTIAIRHIDNMEYVENCIKKITYSSKHLLSLINDILDMSKIEDNKLSINNEMFDFRQLTESITSIIYPQTVEKNQKFDISISGLHEETLIGDMLRLNQILLNLLSNAVKFTPDGGSVTLEITKTGKKNNKIHMRFVVRDTGIGMNREFLERLYTPFEQADYSISQKYGGSGLGMSITKNLVTLMNGTISVETTLGEGTAFIVDLPFGVIETAQPAAGKELSSLNVLVVDDDESTCDHAIVLLEKMNIHARWVCSGQEAVAEVIDAYEKGESFDVCFIDWCMPDMDGIETARNIRRRVGPDTLIIIISAYDWSAIEKEAREAGINAFISKPLFISSLYNTLTSVIFPQSLKSAGDSRYNFMGKKILLAEDHIINQEIAVTLLNDVELIVDCAENGSEALDLFSKSEEGEYALILMDIQMPIMNGYEAARAIRASAHADAKRIPIIAMTANAFHEDVISAEEAGMNGHIAKPIDVDTLYGTIAKHLKISGESLS